MRSTECPSSFIGGFIIRCSGCASHYRGLTAPFSIISAVTAVFSTVDLRGGDSKSEVDNADTAERIVSER